MRKNVPLSLLITIAAFPAAAFAATELTTRNAMSPQPIAKIAQEPVTPPPSAEATPMTAAEPTPLSPQPMEYKLPEPAQPQTVQNEPVAQPTPTAAAPSASGEPKVVTAETSAKGKKQKKKKSKDKTEAKAADEPAPAESLKAGESIKADAPAPAPVMAPQKDTFTEALAQAYVNNPQIKAEREALKAIDESVNQAFSGFLPYAQASASKGRERTSVSHQQWQYGDTNTRGLDIQQDLFNGGESLAAFKAAKERVKAGRAQLKAVEQQVLYNAVVAYTDVVEKQLVLEVNRKNVEVLGKQLEATRARFEVGELTRTDSAQSEARLARARADERQALGDLEASRVTYKRVIGVSPPELLILPPVPAQLPESLEKANDQALAAHPALQVSQHEAKAAEKIIDVRTAAVLPDLSLNGSMSRSEGVSGIGGISRIDNDAITLNVTIPLYQSGAEWSRIREAKNLANQAKFTALDTRHAVSENVDRAWQDFATAQAVITSSEEALVAAELALDSIGQENLSGLRTILDVLDTEQETFNARLNLVKAKRAEKTQAYRLLAAVGRLTANDLGLPVNLYDPAAHYDDVKFKLIGW